MADVEGIVLEPALGVLICKVHGSGVHPDASAVTRHLRSTGHHLKNKRLTEAVAALACLPLRSREALREAHPPVHAQPMRPVPYLTVWPGWSCRTCHGDFLTTSEELRDRHVAKVHRQRAKSHSEDRPLWDSCELQTIFSMTGDRRYFRVISSDGGHEGRATDELQDQGREQADAFLAQLRSRRLKHETAAAAAANVNPDPDTKHGETELWMRKLGLDRYVAGLRKDEMAASYRLPETEGDDGALRDLCDVSQQLLLETWRSCQHGSEQRMTDPQAARISGFWHAADPEGKANSFRRAPQRDTVNRYLKHWTQMLTFCWNGWRGELFPESLKALARGTVSVNQASGGSEEDESSNSDGHSGNAEEGEALYKRYFGCTRRQRRCLEEFVEKAEGYSDTDGSDKDGDGRQRRLAMLRGPAVAFSQAIIQQHLAGSPFDSPLLAYVAMLSIDGRFGSWQEPGSFNSHLSALVYCGQLWIFRFACDRVDQEKSDRREQEEDSDDGLDEELDCQMQRYFSNTVSKPLSYILLWRRRLFSIAPVTMVNRPAAWNLPKTTISYRGCSISMEEVRRLCRSTIDRARGTLYGSLMFEVKHLPRLTPNALEENDSERTAGWWFGKHRQNATILYGREEALAEHVALTADLRELYLEERRGSEGHVTLAWRVGSVRLYQQLVQEFLKDLAVAIHISSGPPVRAPEFLAPIWRNTERLRHVQLRYGKVMIHLEEHKMMATTGKNVNNIRFLCSELGELLVNYLVYVVPLLETMAWRNGSEAVAPSALWVNTEGERWSEKRFGDILKAACRRAEVPAVGTAVWRQMSSAIINTHFDQAEQACLTVAQDVEEPSDDIDEDGQDGLAAALVSMSNHSLRTHRLSYANVSPFANVWDGKLAKSHRASVAWARFFGLDAGEVDSPGTTATSKDGRKRSISPTRLEQNLPRKIRNLGRARAQAKRYWSGAALLIEAQRLYKDDKLRWRCPEQEQALQLVANGAPEVLLILATGSGKKPFVYAR